MICRYHDNIMRFHRYHRMIQGPGWEGGMAFSLAGPREVLRGGLSSVQDWEWQQQCSFHLNQPWWDWRINVKITNGTVYDWNLITILPHLSDVCMSSPPSVASPIIALLFTNRFFGRPWYHCLLAGEKSGRPQRKQRAYEKISFLKMGVCWTPTQGFLGILSASFSCTSLLVPPTGATTPQMDGGMVHEVPNASANDTISTFVRPGWDSVERSIQVL